MNLLAKLGEHTIMKIVPDKLDLSSPKLNESEKQMVESFQTLQKYGVNNPKAIAEFMVGSFEMTMSTMTMELHSIRDDILQPNFSQIDTAIDALGRIYESREEERQRLHEAVDKISVAVRNLFQTISSCIDETDKIEKMSDMQKRMSFLNKLSNKTDNNNYLARRCMDAVIVGMTYAQQIGQRLGEGYVDRLNRDFNAFIDTVLSGNRCLLMHSYDPNGKNSEYWLTVPQGAQDMIESGCLLHQDEADDKTISYEDLDFSE